MVALVKTLRKELGKYLRDFGKRRTLVIVFIQ